MTPYLPRQRRPGGSSGDYKSVVSTTLRVQHRPNTALHKNSRRKRAGASPPSRPRDCLARSC